jgi:hypothetical protein
MSHIIWRSPSPSSGYYRGPTVELRPKREIAITFEFADADDKMRRGELIFRNVVHYRTTYLWALTADMIHDAYDRVVDMGRTRELAEIKSAMRANQRQDDVRHFRLCFDDGPAFDFIAASFEANIV